MFRMQMLPKSVKLRHDSSCLKLAEKNNLELYSDSNFEDVGKELRKFSQLGFKSTLNFSDSPCQRTLYAEVHRKLQNG